MKKYLFHFMFGFLIQMGFAINIYSEEINEGNKMIGLYGADYLLDKKNFTPEKAVNFIMSYNLKAVFGGYKNRDFAKLCKSNNIKLYAELACFQGQQYWKDYPECQPVNSYGNLIQNEEWYYGICPNNENVRNRIMKNAVELAELYKVDGIWLDFIRYPCHWEVKKPNIYQTCFCDVCVNKFMSDTKIDIPLENFESKQEIANYILQNYLDKWQNWKCSVISNYVNKLSIKVKEINPGIKIGIFCVPWKPNEYNGAILNIIGQDYKQLSESGIDIFSPMVYHKMCNKDINWINEITDYTHKITKKITIPIIQACSVPTIMSNDELTSAVHSALKNPSLGVILFSASHIDKENKWEFIK